MRRLRKITLWIAALVFGLGILSWVGLQWYLTTGHARQMASTEVSKILGLPVEIQSLNVGVGGTTVSLVIPDAKADSPTNLLQIGSVETDITIGGLVTGSATPTQLTLRNVEILLRLDDKGQLLSPLPKGADSSGSSRLPAITLDKTKLRITQLGKPDFEINLASGSLRSEGEGYQVEGKIADEQWGNWQIEGRLAADPTDGQLTLKTDKVAVNNTLLNTIPVISSEVWTHFSATGEVAITAELTFRPKEPFNYTVAMQPTGLSVTVPDAAVTVSNVEGQVRVVNGLVKVESGSLQLAAGKVGFDMTYAFADPVSVIKLNVSATGVDVQKLPELWALPKDIQGKLKGQANLEMRIDPEGKLTTLGSGQGEVVGAKFAGLDAEVKLRLQSDGGRYRFVTIPAN